MFYCEPSDVADMLRGWTVHTLELGFVPLRISCCGVNKVCLLLCPGVPCLCGRPGVLTDIRLLVSSMLKPNAHSFLCSTFLRCPVSLSHKTIADGDQSDSIFLSSKNNASAEQLERSLFGGPRFRLRNKSRRV